MIEIKSCYIAAGPASAAPEAHPSSQPDQTEEGSSTQSRDTMTGTTATPSSVAEKGPLDATATQNFPPTSVPFPSNYTLLYHTVS